MVGETSDKNKCSYFYVLNPFLKFRSVEHIAQLFNATHLLVKKNQMTVYETFIQAGKETSVSWHHAGPQLRTPLPWNSLDHHSAIMMRGLKISLNWEPIASWDNSLSDSLCFFFSLGNCNHEQVLRAQGNGFPFAFKFNAIPHIFSFF